jgi:hypothetical protein
MSKSTTNMTATAAIIIFLLWIIAFAGWITHIIMCLSGGLWGFLIAGALFFPIGVVHGIGHWFGAW